MKTVKEFLLSAFVFAIFVFAVSLLMEYQGIYQNAYRELSRRVSHPSIEMWVDKNAGEEE